MSNDLRKVRTSPKPWTKIKAGETCIIQEGKVVLVEHIAMTAGVNVLEMRVRDVNSGKSRGFSCPIGETFEVVLGSVKTGFVARKSVE